MLFSTVTRASRLGDEARSEAELVQQSDQYPLPLLEGGRGHSFISHLARELETIAMGKDGLSAATVT